MNELEKALLTEDDGDLDAYLDYRPSREIRADINALIAKACNEQDAAKKILQIKEILAQP